MRHNCVPRALLCCSQYYPWPKEMSSRELSVHWYQARSDKGIVGICRGEGRGRKDHCVGIGEGVVPFFER